MNTKSYMVCDTVTDRLWSGCAWLIKVEYARTYAHKSVAAKVAKRLVGSVVQESLVPNPANHWSSKYRDDA